MPQKHTGDFAKVLYYYGLIGSNVYDKVKVICPFHEDYKPSMMIDLEKETFYCFGCGKRGNVVDFIREVEGCDNLKAMRKCASIINNKAVKHLNIFYQPKKSKKECLRLAKLYYYTLDQNTWKEGTPTCKYMLNRGFTPDTLIDCGVRENDNFPYGVVAPILDNNQFKGYVCRAIVDSDRKYLYNEGFRRATTLCGNYTRKWVLICEGYLDYLKFRQAGINNVVAILGWKATDYQISKLQRVTDCVISALDNTETGVKGTQYLEEFFDVVRFKFPGGAKDPGDLDKFQMRKALADTKRSIKSYERKKKHFGQHEGTD